MSESQITVAPEEGANGNQVAEILGRTTVSKSFHLGSLARQWELTSEKNVQNVLFGLALFRRAKVFGGKRIVGRGMKP